MRLHERTLEVQASCAQLRQDAIKFQQDHDLTDVEMLQALQGCEDMFLRGLLRAERHPDDPERKADEA